MLKSILGLSVLGVCSLWVITCSGQDDSRRFRFPDTPSKTAQLPRRQAFSLIREQMENGSDGQGLTEKNRNLLRSGLMQLATDPPQDQVTAYAFRRLIILDWQTGRINATEADEQLIELAENQQSPNRYLTLATALTILLRDRNIERFKNEYHSLVPSETPQFGWFASEYARYMVKDYITESATAEENVDGKPVEKEYQRSIEIADFLEFTFLNSIEEYLRQYKDDLNRIDKRQALMSGPSKLERSQIALAMKQVTGSVREVLGRRLYLDVSERTTDVCCLVP